MADNHHSGRQGRGDRRPGDEFRSINADLQTVNGELHHRVADLARANWDLKNLLASTQIATIFLDDDRHVRGFTPVAIEIFDLDETDVGRPIEQLAARVCYPELSTDVGKVLATLNPVERTVSTRDGNHYIARLHPYRSADTAVAGTVLTFLDVTGAVRAETALRESEGRLRILLAELQHRVRNTLSVVKSIARRTAASSSSVEDMETHLVGRLDAFARVQSAVARSPDAGIDLTGIICDEMLAHAAREGEQFSIDGPAVALTPKAAESLSLAFHELTTNAVKHGSLGMPGGQVNVSWTVEGKGGDKRLALVWEESGAADFTAAPGRNGFGMELLSRVLPYELDAGTTVEFGRDGFRFTLGMALDPARVREDKERGA